MQKKSGWDMVSKTMKYVTTMTYRWVLCWWKSPYGVFSHPFSEGMRQLGGVGWLGLGCRMIIKVAVVIIEGVLWEQEC